MASDCSAEGVAELCSGTGGATGDGGAVDAGTSAGAVVGTSSNPLGAAAGAWLEPGARSAIAWALAISKLTKLWSPFSSKRINADLTDASGSGGWAVPGVG